MQNLRHSLARVVWHFEVAAEMQEARYFRSSFLNRLRALLPRNFTGTHCNFTSAQSGRSKGRLQLARPGLCLLCR